MSSSCVSVSAWLDRRLQFIRKQIAFGQRFEDGLAALIQIGQAEQPFADVGDRDFVERAGGFLAVTGDEGHGGAFGKKLAVASTWRG